MAVPARVWPCPCTQAILGLPWHPGLVRPTLLIPALVFLLLLLWLRLACAVFLPLVTPFLAWQWLLQWWPRFALLASLELVWLRILRRPRVPGLEFGHWFDTLVPSDDLGKACFLEMLWRMFLDLLVIRLWFFLFQLEKMYLKLSFAAQTHLFVVSTVLIAPCKMYRRLTFTAQTHLVVVSTVLVVSCRST